MTVRDVSCAFCFTIRNFTEMVMCPQCGKALCPRCAVEGAQKAGTCGRRETCPGQPAHPLAEPAAPAPNKVGTESAPAPRQGLLRRLAAALSGKKSP